MQFQDYKIQQWNGNTFEVITTYVAEWVHIEMLFVDVYIICLAGPEAIT